MSETSSSGGHVDGTGSGGDADSGGDDDEGDEGDGGEGRRSKQRSRRGLAGGEDSEDGAGGGSGLGRIDQRRRRDGQEGEGDWGEAGGTVGHEEKLVAVGETPRSGLGLQSRREGFRPAMASIAGGVFDQRGLGGASSSSAGGVASGGGSQGGSESDSAGKEEASKTDGAEEEPATLPPEFIPDVAFDEAPSVRFVFSARLDPVHSPPGASRNRGHKRRKGVGKGTRKGKGEGESKDDGHRRGLSPEASDLEQEHHGDGEVGVASSHPTTVHGAQGFQSDGVQGTRGSHNPGVQWRRRAGKGHGNGGAGNGRGRRAPAKPIFGTLETGWTPLTRIRQEHAPMPAPETKCMQVFGGVHNYRTKMCEVYERLSRVCVQVRCGRCLLWCSLLRFECFFVEYLAFLRRGW